MNIVILANRDLASNLALNLLIPELVEKHRLWVFLSAKVGHSTELPPELRELQFFEQTLFNDLLFPALESNEMGGELLGFGDLGRLVGHEIEILSRPNTKKGLLRLQSVDPDLILCIRYGGILKARALAIPSHGVINLHSGLLPEYKGVMATFRALLHGEGAIGTTLHTIDDATIDTGRIFGHTRIPVAKGRSYLWHVLQLYPGGCRLMLDTVERIRRGEPLAPRPQEGPGAYYSFPTTADLATFRAAGLALFDVGEITEIAQRYLPTETAERPRKQT